MKKYIIVNTLNVQSCDFKILRKACNQMAFNEISYKACQCLLYAEYPRGQVAQKDGYRYCSQVTSNLTELEVNTNCVIRYLSNRLERQRRSGKGVRLSEEKRCAPRCSYYTYDSKLFSTIWKARRSEISWYVKAINQVNSYASKENNQNISMAKFVEQAYLRLNVNQSHQINSISGKASTNIGSSVVRVFRATDDLEVRNI